MSVTHVVESGLVCAPYRDVWAAIKKFDLKWNSSVASVEPFEGKASANEVGSHHKITYVDKTHEVVRITEFSETRQSISFELIHSEPTKTFQSAAHTINVYNVSSNKTTFVEMITDFSSDAKLEIVEDNKYKKKEALVDLDRHFKKLGFPKKCDNAWVIATLKAKDEKSADSLISTVRESKTVESVRGERGCQKYVYLRSVKDPKLFIVVEKYTDEKASAEHTKKDVFKNFVAKHKDQVTTELHLMKQVA